MASSERSARSRSRRNGAKRPAQVARAALSVLAELTGRRAETVLGIHRDEDGWKVTVEVVELSRVPNSTDLLGCYVVALDEEGELIGYERIRRYQRGHAGEERV